MKATKQQQQALLSMLGRIYEEIRQAESENGIQAGPADFRARIEYFHDAVRDYTAGVSGHETTGRLTVESLAYDIGLLRQISANPVSRIAIPQRLSPGTAVAMPRPAARSGRPDADLRYRLMDLYKNYTLLFAAMLAEPADRNYYTRVEEHNAEVEEMAALEQALKQASSASLESLILEQIGDPDLRRKLLAQLKGKPRPEASAQLKAAMKNSDAQIARIDKAHMHYLSSQLAIYEESRELVKKMAVSGMNIVGDFVGAAMAEATRASRTR